MDKYNSLGQSWILHASLSSLLAEGQSSSFGGWLLHARLRDLVPPPHEMEQGVQSPQKLHPELTVNTKSFQVRYTLNDAVHD